VELSADSIVAKTGARDTNGSDGEADAALLLLLLLLLLLPLPPLAT
jgi:hypothetical protein